MTATDSAPASWQPDRLLYSLRETQSLLHISHATCYRLIGLGALDARKIGTATRITAESIREYAGSLPKIGAAAA
jgi:hypothetical protein